MGIKTHFQNHGKKWAGAGVGVALAFVSAKEGFSPVAKHERIDPPGVYTYCFGRTNYDDPSIKPGDRCTKEKGLEFLQADLIEKYAPPLQKCIKDFDKMPPHRQASQVSEAYNLGPGVVCKKAAPFFNRGDVVGGCNALINYNRSNGKYIRGLDIRRKQERDMCLRND